MTFRSWLFRAEPDELFRAAPAEPDEPVERRVIRRTSKPNPERTHDERRALNDAAKAILADPAFTAAREEAQERLVNALIQARGTDEKLELVAKLKCLSQIAAELAVLMNDYRMSADRARGTRPG